VPLSLSRRLVQPTIFLLRRSAFLADLHCVNEMQMMGRGARDGLPLTPSRPLWAYNVDDGTTRATSRPPNLV